MTKGYLWLQGQISCSPPHKAPSSTTGASLHYTQNLLCVTATFPVESRACFLSLFVSTDRLAYKLPGGSLGFLYVVFWTLLAFLTLVLFTLCVPSVLSYLQIYDKEMKRLWLKVPKVKTGKDVTLKSQHGGCSYGQPRELTTPAKTSQRLLEGRPRHLPTLSKAQEVA